MIIAFTQGADAPTVSPVVLSDNAAIGSAAVGHSATGNSDNSCPLPQVPPAQVRHLIFGTLGSVQHTIAHLHALGYAEANDWSRPISTGRVNEVMAILTKRLAQ